MYVKDDIILMKLMKIPEKRGDNHTDSDIDNESVEISALTNMN